MPRNYTQESRQHKKPAYRKADAARHRARYKLQKEGKVKKGDGKEVDHKKNIAQGGTNGRSNLRVTSRAVNRRKQPPTKKRGASRGK